MARPDTAAETRIGRNWGKSAALAVICVLLVALCWYGIQIEPERYYERRAQNVSYIFLPVFSLLSVFVIYRLIVPMGAVLRLRPSGFTDPRAGRREIPWSQITNVARRGEFVQLTLRRPFARTYRRSLTQSLLNHSRKSAGPCHVLIAEWCLATSQGALVELVTSYWRAHGKGTGDKAGAG